MAPTSQRALVLFSGGQDSTVCLAWALAKFPWVETVGFDYGQRHAVELEARDHVRAAIQTRLPGLAHRLGDDHVLDIRSFGALGETAMTTDRAIEMTDRGLPSTYVPGRNLVFLTYAAALADRRGLQSLVGGMCETDYSGYPDCRRATLDALQNALRLGMEREFEILTPLMALTNALSAISLVGSLVILGENQTTYSTILGFVAVVASTINVVGGFLITDKMLRMFRRAPRPAAPAREEAKP